MSKKLTVKSDYDLKYDEEIWVISFPDGTEHRTKNEHLIEPVMEAFSKGVNHGKSLQKVKGKEV